MALFEASPLARNGYSPPSSRPAYIQPLRQVDVLCCDHLIDVRHEAAVERERQSDAFLPSAAENDLPSSHSSLSRLFNLLLYSCCSIKAFPSTWRLISTQRTRSACLCYNARTRRLDLPIYRLLNTKQYSPDFRCRRGPNRRGAQHSRQSRRAGRRRLGSSLRGRSLLSADAGGVTEQEQGANGLCWSYGFTWHKGGGWDKKSGLSRHLNHGGVFHKSISACLLRRRVGSMGLPGSTHFMNAADTSPNRDSLILFKSVELSKAPNPIL
jgi:hypothetical protein